MPMIITIDGPAGTGKSTVARELAGRLGFRFLDTGAMYRAVAWFLLEKQVPLGEHAHVEELAKQMKLEFHNNKVFAQNVNITSEIRTERVTSAASHVASLPAVRAELVARQKEIGKQIDLVTEGRDQGTVVFPHAECKFFLTANPEIRAKRRYEELKNRGEAADYDQIYHSQLERDFRDQHRKEGPLKPAENSIIIDTTELNLTEVIDCLYRIVLEKMKSHGNEMNEK